jgi:hypothetical protein
MVLVFIWECVPRLDGSVLRSAEDTEVSLKRKAIRSVGPFVGSFVIGNEDETCPETMTCLKAVSSPSKK